MEKLVRCDLCGGGEFQSYDDHAGIDQCIRCGYLFDNPRPTTQDIIAYYSRTDTYAGWLQEEKARDALWKRRLKKMRPYIKTGALLDVSTGTGQFLHHARPYFDHVEGTEVSRIAIEIAKHKYGLAIKDGQFEDIPFHRSFDTITMFHVLEHVPYPRRVISKCRDLLHAGGTLFIAVPNDVDSIRTRAKTFLKSTGLRKSERGRPMLPRIALDGSVPEIHLSHFSNKVIDQLLTGEGFAIVDHSLDPYFVSSGMTRLKNTLYYYSHLLLNRLTSLNWYDTIWIAAKKR
jgi:SAM-dependent methyltransferase